MKIILIFAFISTGVFAQTKEFCSKIDSVTIENGVFSKVLRIETENSVESFKLKDPYTKKILKAFEQASWKDDTLCFSGQCKNEECSIIKTKHIYLKY